MKSLFCCYQTEGFASAEATKGLCGRPLDSFAPLLDKQIGFPAMIISLAHLETLRKPPLVYNSTNFSIPHVQRDYHPKPCVPSARWGRPCEASATEIIRYGGTGGRHPLMHAWRPPGGFCYFSPRRKVASITNQERKRRTVSSPKPLPTNPKKPALMKPPSLISAPLF